MSETQEIAQMAHLMRRAGFGASRDELERLVAQGYEETVEQLVDPPALMCREPTCTCCSATCRRSRPAVR